VLAEGEMKTPCEVRDRVAYDFEVVAGAWKHVGTEKSKEERGQAR
jgi:hypothetical protein